MGTGPIADGQAHAESDHTESDTADFDIVVAGSGAAGMTAALTAAHRGATVVVLEKTGSFGGSTARSGGGIWAPGNTVLRRAGVADTPELARSYLAHVAGEDVPAELRDALLEHGPAMLDLVLATTPLRLAWVPGYADYYPEAPGGLASGRSVEPVPFNGSVLGGELARLNRPYLPVPRGVAVTQADYRWLTLGARHPRAILASLKVAGRLARSRLLGHRMLSLGQALAAGLRAGLLAERRAGVAGFPADRPGGDGRPGHRGQDRAGREADADPGAARRADRHRGVRAQRADATASTSGRRSGPTGRPARPGTPATGSWPASGSARRPA